MKWKTRCDCDKTNTEHILGAGWIYVPQFRVDWSVLPADSRWHATDVVWKLKSTQKVWHGTCSAGRCHVSVTRIARFRLMDASDQETSWSEPPQGGIIPPRIILAPLAAGICLISPDLVVASREIREVDRLTNHEPIPDDQSEARSRVVTSENANKITWSQSISIFYAPINPFIATYGNICVSNTNSCTHHTPKI